MTEEKKKRRRKKNKCQKICKQVIEDLTGDIFLENVRPDFLKNKDGIGGRKATNRNLELDIFSPDLMLAIEYQGKQHTNRVRKWQRKKGDFEYQKAKDQWKREKCSQYKIILIEVPHTLHSKDIKSFLYEQICKLEIV